jgi:Flp pilus assembly protein TadG
LKAHQRFAQTWGELGDVYAGRRHASQGQVAVIFAMLLLVLVGFVALSIDGGYVMAERRQAQSAADAGALAAAKSLFDTKTGDIQSSGISYATQNAGSGSSAVVDWPPASGAHAGDDKYVQVSVTKEVRKFFVGAVYDGDWNVTASAVAGIETDPADYALIALDRDDEPGIGIVGTTGIKIRGGKASAMSNTNVDGNGTTDFEVPGSIDAHGSITGPSSWSTRRPGMPQIDDPLDWMSEPNASSMVNRIFPSCTSDATLEPGIYRNQNCTIRRTFKLNAGVYYFQNTDIDLLNTNSTIEGKDVILYFDSASAFDPKNGNVDLRTTGTTSYSGASRGFASGSYGSPGSYQTGLVIWFASCGNVDMQGGARLHFEGIFYAPCANVSMHGNPSDDTLKGQMFVGTLDARGTSDLNIAYVKWADTARPRVYLVE